jgi:hypothetical protein
MYSFLQVLPSLYQVQQQHLPHLLLPLVSSVVEVPLTPSRPLYVPAPCRLLTEDNVNIVVVLISAIRAL